MDNKDTVRRAGVMLGAPELVVILLPLWTPVVELDAVLKLEPEVPCFLIGPPPLDDAVVDFGKPRPPMVILAVFDLTLFGPRSILKLASLLLLIY